MVNQRERERNTGGGCRPRGLKVEPRRDKVSWATSELDLWRGSNDRREREGPNGIFFFLPLIEPPWLLIIGVNGIEHHWNCIDQFHLQWLGLKFNNGGGVWWRWNGIEEIGVWIGECFWWGLWNWSIEMRGGWKGTVLGGGWVPERYCARWLPAVRWPGDGFEI